MFMVLGAMWLYHSFGIDGLIRGGMVIVGLGFLIFIHELGHFLTAKWCDVHVQTFSIGFGPALPGCSFTRGETTYKIAVLPLGGYVNMVGEGPEADEDEDYPRSFKNKTVGQRMLIISAGVIMNLLFGALAIILVYRMHGVPRTAAEVWRTDSGSPAWIAGVHPGWKIVSIDGKKDPWFDDLKVAVALSSAGRPIHFVFRDPAGNLHERDIEPVRDENNLMPAIGVSPGMQMTLETKRRLARPRPVYEGSAAAAARALDLARGDVVQAMQIGEDGKKEPLPKGAEGWDELGKRLREAGDKPLVLTVLRAGTTQAVTVEAAPGFLHGDRIIGTTDPATPDEPFNVTPLPEREAANKEKRANPFAFRDRMRKLAGKTVVIQVRRDKGTEKESASAVPVNVLVPAAFHVSLGLRMKMGKVAAIRDDSPAAAAGLQPDHVIQGVQLVYGDEKLSPLSEKELDPVRLPYELAQRITGDPKRPDVMKWKVILSVTGRAPREQGVEGDPHDASHARPLPPMAWDASWHLGDEAPVNPSAPLSIPQLGLAYYVESTVMKVVPDSPAAKAGVQAGDEVRFIRFREIDRTPGTERFSPSEELKSRRNKTDAYDEWAHYFWVLQHFDHATVKVKVQRGGQEVEVPEAIKAEPDPTWPLTSRGLILKPDIQLQKAEDFRQAVRYGLDYTAWVINQIYLSLSSYLNGRLSTKSLGGPIEIASQAFAFAGANTWEFTLFLGLISINLAVVNFLPIPVLDGGHMVFLIYEKLRGRPPSELVRVVATYVGLAMILSLMVFVFWQDIWRLWRRS
jgi:regulator of sigma E protease